MRNGWSSGISDDRACYRADRTKHHGARNSTQGSITATPLGQRYRRYKRQGYRRRKEKPFHIWFPMCILIEHETPELRPNNGTGPTVLRAIEYLNGTSLPWNERKCGKLARAVPQMIRPRRPVMKEVPCPLSRYC
jgi:hypothetical protein